MTVTESITARQAVSSEAANPPSGDLSAELRELLDEGQSCKVGGALLDVVSPDMRLAFPLADFDEHGDPVKPPLSVIKERQARLDQISILQQP